MTQKWYQKASVQASIVGGVFLIATTLITVIIGTRNSGKHADTPKILREYLAHAKDSNAFRPQPSLEGNDKSIDLSELSHEGRLITGDSLEIIIESIHTGQSLTLLVSASISIAFLTHMAVDSFELKKSVDFGTFKPIKVNWVLVDTRVKDLWENLSYKESRKVKLFLGPVDAPQFSYSTTDQLKDFKMENGLSFNLFANPFVRPSPRITRNDTLKSIYLHINTGARYHRIVNIPEESSFRRVRRFEVTKETERIVLEIKGKQAVNIVYPYVVGGSYEIRYGSSYLRLYYLEKDNRIPIRRYRIRNVLVDK